MPCWHGEHLCIPQTPPLHPTQASATDMCLSGRCKRTQTSNLEQACQCPGSQAAVLRWTQSRQLTGPYSRPAGKARACRPSLPQARGAHPRLHVHLLRHARHAEALRHEQQLCERAGTLSPRPLGILSQVRVPHPPHPVLFLERCGELGEQARAEVPQELAESLHQLAGERGGDALVEDSDVLVCYAAPNRPSVTLQPSGHTSSPHSRAKYEVRSSSIV